jgi:hypothetical protein
MAVKDDEDKKQADEADRLKAEETRFAEIANRAATEHVKRVTAKFEKELKDRDDKIAALQADRVEKKDPQAPELPAGVVDVNLAKYKELEARIAERDRKLDEADRERKQVEAQRRTDEEISATQAALAEVGITGKALRGALALLKEDKRIGRDDAGRVCFLVPKDGYTDKLPIEDGIRAWADTDEGKMYRPAVGVTGSGAKPQPRQTGGSKPTRSEAVNEAKQALANAFGFGSR